MPLTGIRERPPQAATTRSRRDDVRELVRIRRPSVLLGRRGRSARAHMKTALPGTTLQTVVISAVAMPACPSGKGWHTRQNSEHSISQPRATWVGHPLNADPVDTAAGGCSVSPSANSGDVRRRLASTRHEQATQPLIRTMPSFTPGAMEHLRCTSAWHPPRTRAVAPANTADTFVLTAKAMPISPCDYGDAK